MNNLNEGKIKHMRERVRDDPNRILWKTSASIRLYS
jgi:hypothetical protein